MGRKLLILDDDQTVLETYRGIFIPETVRPLVVSSRRGGAAVAPAVAPVSLTAQFAPSFVTNGLEALEQIEAGLKSGEPFVGGFFDVKLGPGIDGIETIRLAKELDPNMLCVIVTAYQDRSIEEITKIFGEEFSDRWDFMSKPFTEAEIIQKAKNLVSNWDRRERERKYIEEIKSQQEQLLRSERLAAVGTLARGIGHEFGNILLRIMGKAELALNQEDPKVMESALKVIVTASERAGVIVRNLQSMVRMQVEKESVAVTVPLQESIELIGHELKKANVKLTHKTQPDLPLLHMNKIEIGQVFLNLMINAVHAMQSKGGELKIHTKKEGKGVSVDFTDTGTGIAEEHLERIFEPLYTTKGDKGSGIGLSVSNKIVENHGGQIRVKTVLNKGTTFTVWLPTP